MRRTIATLGVVGLGVLGATVAAQAAPQDTISICHATGAASNPYNFQTMSLNALSAHVGDTGDIVPVNHGTVMPEGQNLTTANIEFLANGCAAVGSTPTGSPTATATATATDSPTATATATVTTPATDSTTPATEPVVSQPTVETVVVPPASTPVTVAPAAAAPAAAPAAAAPQAAAAAVPAAAATNVGYNVQTAAGKSDAGIPQWLAALTGLFTGAAALVLWRSGARGRKSNG